MFGFFLSLFTAVFLANNNSKSFPKTGCFFLASDKGFFFCLFTFFLGGGGKIVFLMFFIFEKVNPYQKKSLYFFLADKVSFLVRIYFCFFRRKKKQLVFSPQKIKQLLFGKICRFRQLKFQKCNNFGHK